MELNYKTKLYIRRIYTDYLYAYNNMNLISPTHFSQVLSEKLKNAKVGSIDAKVKAEILARKPAYNAFIRSLFKEKGAAPKAEGEC